MPRTIVHLDADAFFASVEQAADSRLRGKPIAVGGGKRGIIASASYEARQFGIYTPMPTARARKLCPKLIVLPGDFERYEQFSHWMFGYCYDFTPDVEQTSIDEGYFDLSASRQKPPVEIALRRPPGHRPIAENHPSARASPPTNWSARSPPNSTSPPRSRQVPPGGEGPFLHPLPNQWLPGIGPKTAHAIERWPGWRKSGTSRRTPLEMLELAAGRPGPPPPAIRPRD